MKLNFLLLALLLGCSNVKTSKPAQTPEVEVGLPTEVVTEIPKVPQVDTPKENIEAHVGEGSDYTQPVKPLPSASGEFTTNIVTQKCSADYIKKVEEGAIYLKRIMNSQEYKKLVLDFTYNGKKAFVDNEKMTNAEVYDHLIGGAEALRPTLNYQMDLVVECYTDSFSRTIGYTYPSVNRIYVNMKYHKSYTACETAANVEHEWTHKMGFGHAVNWATSRDYSVPYAHGTFVDKLCNKAKAGSLTPLK